MCGSKIERGELEQLDASAVEAELSKLSSAKLEYVRHLAKKAAEQGDQMLVFSYWTATLDLLEPILESQDIPYCRWQTLSLTCLHACLFICLSPITIPIILLYQRPSPDTTSRSQAMTLYQFCIKCASASQPSYGLVVRRVDMWR